LVLSTALDRNRLANIASRSNCQPRNAKRLVGLITLDRRPSSGSLARCGSLKRRIASQRPRGSLDFGPGRVGLAAGMAVGEVERQRGLPRDFGHNIVLRYIMAARQLSTAETNGHDHDTPDFTRSKVAPIRSLDVLVVLRRGAEPIRRANDNVRQFRTVNADAARPSARTCHRASCHHHPSRQTPPGT
jgi:hypothetical protein